MWNLWSIESQTVYLCYAFVCLAFTLLSVFSMDSRNSSKSWNVLCWNIRGLVAENKWESLKNKVTENQCDMICLQETKKEKFDILFIKLFLPPPPLLTVFVLSHPLEPLVGC